MSPHKCIRILALEQPAALKSRADTPFGSEALGVKAGRRNNGLEGLFRPG